MIKFMLDTNIVIYTIKNKPTKVRETFKKHADQMCISSVTLMELIYGAERSSRPEENLKTIEGLAARLDVLPYEDEAAAHTGQIRSDLAKVGKPIGPYDNMIAGHARSRGLILVTNNENEFKRVSGLRSINWA